MYNLLSNLYRLFNYGIDGLDSFFGLFLVLLQELLDVPVLALLFDGLGDWFYLLQAEEFAVYVDKVPDEGVLWPQAFLVLGKGVVENGNWCGNGSFLGRFLFEYFWSLYEVKLEFIWKFIYLIFF